LLVLQQRFPAPGRGFEPRSGAFVLSALVLALTACDSGSMPGAAPTIELNGETVQLERGASIKDIQLQAANGMDIEPDSVLAHDGDALRFIAEDASTHAIVFDAARLDSLPEAFLTSTHQLRGPPLVDPGSTWVVSLAGAPAGTYPFVCLTHGAQGKVVVTPE
jgi:plastocyanin